MADWIWIVLIVLGLVATSITIGCKLRKSFKPSKKDQPKKEHGSSLSQDELDVIRGEGEGFWLRKDEEGGN